MAKGRRREGWPMLDYAASNVAVTEATNCGNRDDDAELRRLDRQVSRYERWCPSTESR